MRAPNVDAHRHKLTLSSQRILSRQNWRVCARCVRGLREGNIGGGVASPSAEHGPPSSACEPWNRLHRHLYIAFAKYSFAVTYILFRPLSMHGPSDAGCGRWHLVCSSSRTSSAAWLLLQASSDLRAAPTTRMDVKGNTPPAPSLSAPLLERSPLRSAVLAEDLQRVLTALRGISKEEVDATGE